MSKTIVVIGYGPGVSTAVAEKFGAEGFSVALVARTESRLAEGVAALKAKGIKAAAIPADAGDPASILAAIAAARDRLGPITAIHWNAYSGAGVDLLETDPLAVRGVFDVAIVGLLSAIQAALADLTAAGDGAVLVTNGAFGDLTPEMDAFALQLKSVGVALANAGKAKLVGLLAQQLKPLGIQVGEVTIAGIVKGTAWDSGSGAIDPAAIAAKFWDLYKTRGPIRDRIS